MKRLTRAALVVVLLVGPALAPLASAQSSVPSAGPQNNAGLLRSLPKNVDQHIAKLHDALKITPAEEPQWAPFAQVMRENSEAMQVAFQQRAESLPTMSAVQNLQSYAYISSVQAQNLKQLAAAFQTLYNRLPPDQQKLADQVFREQISNKKHG
jgi:Skp family chaperone for outer membrane proteins